MKTKEVRCPRIRENKVCNQKVLKYEGDISKVIIYPYCRKCKKEIKLFNNSVEI